MKFRRCLILLLLDILGSTYTQYYVLAVDGDDDALFYKDVVKKEDLEPIFEEDADPDTCIEPPIPSFGELFCGKLKLDSKRYVCIAQCDPGYEFPNRVKNGNLKCSLTTGQWKPKNKFPDCEKEVICKPSCINGGVCKTGNVCGCPSRYTGKACEEDKCDDPPSPPNSKISCKTSTENPDRYLCQVECKAGFEFPSKEKKENRFCDLQTGVWMPENEFPQCQRICTPPCQNGGTCIEGNVCVCTRYFKGNQCEIDVCKDPPIPLNGKMTCGPLINAPRGYMCVAECEAEYQFPNEERKETHVCDLDTGNWVPKHEFSDCEPVCNPSCQNEGECVAGNKCVCTPDFEGNRCENARCNPPCQNEGRCMEGNRCVCKAKFEGDRCENVMCDPPCQNGGRCMGRNRCSCKPEFEGKKCQNAKCNPICQNGGKCIIGNICNCKAQFRGERCQYAKCMDPPPPLNGKLSCENHLHIPERYLCQAECEPGYQLPKAGQESSHFCDLNTGEWEPEYEFPDCEPTCNPPCQNGGQCVEGNICICTPEFTGNICEDGICQDPPPPLNGNMTCEKVRNSPDRYMCNAECHSEHFFPNKWKKARHFCNLNTGEWSPNYEFPDCEPICNPSCQNGGKCTKGNQCVCIPPFIGERCQLESCKEPPPPLNGKLLCRNLVSTPYMYFCQGECDEGYQFPNGGIKENQICNLNTGEWNPKYGFSDCATTCNPPCQNGGQCIEGNLCVCAPEFEGERCQDATCNPPCQNGGQCIEGNLCVCAPEFEGDRCQDAMCNPPCENGGQCFEGNVCICTSQFEGERCQHSDIGHSVTATCDPPCQNGGQCIEGDICMCTPDFIGERCQNRNISICDPPCQNGGKCIEGDICICNSGNSGERCEHGVLKICPEVPESFKKSCPKSCSQGFACNGTSCVRNEDCPCFKNGMYFKPTKTKLIRENCQRCECAVGGHSKCEPMKCPDCLPDEKPQMDSNCRCTCIGCAVGTILCPTNGECLHEELWCDGIVDCPDDEIQCPNVTDPTENQLPPKPNENPLICSTDRTQDTDSCEMLGNIFETFDGLTYQYEICNHVLMKESNSELYSITVQKTCSDGLEFCSRQLVINVDGMIIKLGPGIDVVTIKNTKVPVSNLWLVSQRFPEFEVKKNGNTLVFRSFKHNFDVTWDKLEDARVTVSRCLVDNIVGLCGSYNKQLEDERRMPNGKMASGNDEFGNSWAIGSSEKCRQPKNPPGTLRPAIEICNKLRQEPFNASCFQYAKTNSRIQACIRFMRDCIRRSTEARSTPLKDNSSGVDQCKCQAYESFVEACETGKQRPVQEWRILYDCTPTCPEGMEWQDCGPGCELTCDNYRQRSTICSSTCVPGCYCPPGLVRHQNQCVKPKMCQDCVCRGHGDPNYITFDGHYYAFQGNCTYIVAQHQTSDIVMNFRISSKNVECPDEPLASCIEGVTVYWNGHVIEKMRNRPVSLDQKPLTFEDSPLDEGGISITYVPNKSTLVHIKEINLSVRYFDQIYGFNIELPSFIYYNKTEGLCGVCNFIESDDLYHRDGYVSNDIEEFAYSWLEAPGTRKNCEMPLEDLPEAPPGICNFMASSCDVLLDPLPYSKSCQNDIKYSHSHEASICRSKFQYAQQCCERGVSMVDWLKLNGCDSPCPGGMVFKCTSACPKTCENYKTYREDDCRLMPLHTCVCPEGEVLKLGKCVNTTQCAVCDAQGHTIGDVWQDGPCKTCKCRPDLSTSCTVQKCPQPPLCGGQERLLKLSRGNTSCCDSYKCAPKPTRSCPEPKLGSCPPGKSFVKFSTTSCPVYRCECFPELCPPSVVPFLTDGETFTVVTTDCCPEIKVTCNPNLCAHPPKCNLGFKLSVEKDRCCYKYQCVPQKHVCIYSHKYDVVNGTQVELPLEGHYDKEYEPGSSWQDGLCRTCSCSERSGQLWYSCTVETCPNPNDFPGADKYAREEFRIPGFCCPKYVRTHCIHRGVKRKIGEVWTSAEDNSCNKSSRCVLDENGEAIIRVTTICEKPCQEENVVAADPRGCCANCGTPNNTCSAVAVPVNETRGFFEYVDERRGRCSNRQAIYALKKCSGRCDLKSPNLVLVTGNFEDVCNCCTPREIQYRTIYLECENGSKLAKKYAQPVTCQCTYCSGKSNNHDTDDHDDDGVGDVDAE